MASSVCIAVYRYLSMAAFPSQWFGKYCLHYHNSNAIIHLFIVIIFVNYLRFGAFETLKEKMADHNGQLTTGGKLLAGLGAGVCEAIFAVTPMETIKVKFINDQRSANPKFRGFFHGVSSIVKKEG